MHDHNSNATPNKRAFSLAFTANLVLLLFTCLQPEFCWTVRKLCLFCSI